MEDFSFSDVIAFAVFVVALLTYIDRKKKQPALRLAPVRVTFPRRKAFSWRVTPLKMLC